MPTSPRADIETALRIVEAQESLVFEERTIIKLEAALRRAARAAGVKTRRR